MEFSLLLIIIAVIVGIYLIFKLIKKIIFAIISAIFFVALVVGGVFALVYIDFNQLSNTTDFNVDVIYLKDNSAEFGLNFEVKNGSFDYENIKSLSQSDLENLVYEDIKKEDNLFVLTIDEATFSKLVENQEYDLTEFATNDAFSSFEMILSGEEIKQIINSNDDIDTFLEIIFERNNVRGILKDAAKPLGKLTLETALESKGVTLKEMLFLLALKQSLENQNSILVLLDAYKNEGVEIYPDRFTFKLVRMLPIGVIKDNLPNLSVAEN